MFEMEKDVSGYEGLYTISDDGSILSKERVKKNRWGGVIPVKEGLIKPQMTKAGYLQVTLSKEGTDSRVSLHRLVAEHFVEKIRGLDFVNHKDGNKLNNSSSNLEWCTSAYNTAHAISTGLFTPRKGDRVVTSKLTENQVREIKSSDLSNKALADMFSVKPDCIRHIRSGRTWKHI